MSPDRLGQCSIGQLLRALCRARAAFVLVPPCRARGAGPAGAGYRCAGRGVASRAVRWRRCRGGAVVVCRGRALRARAREAGWFCGSAYRCMGCHRIVRGGFRSCDGGGRRAGRVLPRSGCHPCRGPRSRPAGAGYRCAIRMLCDRTVRRWRCRVSAAVAVGRARTRSARARGAGRVAVVAHRITGCRRIARGRFDRPVAGASCRRVPVPSRLGCGGPRSGPACRRKRADCRSWPWLREAGGCGSGRFDGGVAVCRCGGGMPGLGRCAPQPVERASFAVAAHRCTDRGPPHRSGSVRSNMCCLVLVPPVPGPRSEPGSQQSPGPPSLPSPLPGTGSASPRGAVRPDRPGRRSPARSQAHFGGEVDVSSRHRACSVPPGDTRRGNGWVGS
jgi:hypothetical protein